MTLQSDSGTTGSSWELSTYRGTRAAERSALSVQAYLHEAGRRFSRATVPVRQVPTQSGDYSGYLRALSGAKKQVV